MMFADSLEGESVLHLAVLHNDISEVSKLAKDESLRQSINHLGYTPLELAHFLGKKEIIEILELTPLNKINVLLKGEKTEKKFTPDQFWQVFGVTYCSSLRFKNYPLLKEVIKCCPWILKKSWLGQENRELGVLYKEKISQGFTVGLTVKWIDEQIGYGLFAQDEIPEGTFVGEYAGQVRRLFRLHPDTNPYCFHYPTRFWSWKYFAIDSLREGNVIRFINHSDKPNLQPMCLVERGLLHHVFFAKTKIYPNTQLTFDYGEDYWMRRKKFTNIDGVLA